MTPPVITLMPDYGCAFLWVKEGGVDERGVGPNGGECFGGIEPMSWSDEESHPVPLELWRALCEWQLRFERAKITPVGQSVLLDWDDYHREGLALAQQLKQLWGDTARVRYVKPVEDPGHADEERRELLENGSYRVIAVPPRHGNTLREIPWRVLQRVHERLSDIGETHDVEILYAIESGSRAWGFASPDSDFDVRFIYAHRTDWYSRVFESRDVIETPIEEVEGAVFDVNGWDLRKALRLLYKSNPVLIEWLQSPIAYAAQGLHVPNASFVEELLALAQQFHSPTAAHHHYFHMARKNFREHLLEEPIKLKKYFYVLRPVLACLWIERGMGLPPMALMELMQGVLPAGPLTDEIVALRAEKMSTPEFGSGPRRTLIHAFLVRELERLARVDLVKPERRDTAALDEFLHRWALPAR